MTNELKGYIKVQAIIGAAFNFFINGMIAALIYHKVDYVPTDTVSIAIDLTATCLFIFILTALFGRASVRRTKTVGILETGSRMMRFFSRLFRHSILFGAVMGIVTAMILFALTAPAFALLGIASLRFGVYIVLKCVFAALLGGGAAVLTLRVGMCKTK